MLQASNGLLSTCWYTQITIIQFGEITSYENINIDVITNLVCYTWSVIIKFYPPNRDKYSYSNIVTNYGVTTNEVAINEFTLYILLIMG